MNVPQRQPILRKWLRRGVFAGVAFCVAAAITFTILLRVIPFPEERLTQQPASPSVTDRTGQPLLTKVGEDDQWRHPVTLSDISPWIVQATIAVEDERFRSHFGIDLIAVMRAACQNLRAGRTVSGASTLTMQVCRMMDDRPRTWRAKCVEAFRAIQLEQRFEKDRILETYLNMAPYGGNLRGVEAASRRYFSRSAADVTLAEAALLAGLPQAPSRLQPDRHPDAALQRRRTVLRRMEELGMITAAQREAAAASNPELNPMHRTTRAHHAALMALASRPGGGRTTIDPNIQADIERLVVDHVGALPSRTQAAAVVIDIASGDIVALVGSVKFGEPIDGQVNGATARRSPGSALKPFVYAAAFENRRLSPDSTVYDVPVNLAGWTPNNFDRGFAGPISAAEALRRSLNIPAILVAQGTGLARVEGVIESAGIALPQDALASSGLGVVVGAAEVTLLDLTNGYATIGRGGVRITPRLFCDERSEPVKVMDANVCAALDAILSSQHRRPAGMEDLAEADVPWFMWKTGTSSRRRDAWAVGHNRRFAIGVWVGRFSGAGSSAYVGGEVAEPLLAHVFSLPEIRSNEVPPPAEPWTVRCPLPPPPQLEQALAIVAPEDGAVFVAVNDRTVIHPAANRTAGVTWFLDDTLIGSDETERLSVLAGTHTLRCVDQTGSSSAIRFFVRPER